MKMISTVNIEFSSPNCLVPDEVPNVLTFNSPNSYDEVEKFLANHTSLLLNGSDYKRRQYFFLALNIVLFYFKHFELNVCLDAFCKQSLNDVFELL